MGRNDLLYDDLFSDIQVMGDELFVVLEKLEVMDASLCGAHLSPAALLSRSRFYVSRKTYYDK